MSWIKAVENTQKPQVNAHADTSCRAKGLNFGLSLQLHPYIVDVSSKGSGKSVHFAQALFKAKMLLKAGEKTPLRPKAIEKLFLWQI